MTQSVKFKSPGNPARDDLSHVFLAYLSFNLSNAVMSALDRRLEPLGLTPVQMAIVFRCHTGDADTVTGLTRIVPIGPTGISRQVEQLVRKGLLRRHHMGDDRRVVRLTLTREGQALIPDIVRCRREYEAALLEGLSEDEKKALIAIVEKILANAAKDESQPPHPDPAVQILNSG